MPFKSWFTYYLFSDIFADSFPFQAELIIPSSFSDLEKSYTSFDAWLNNYLFHYISVTFFPSFLSFLLSTYFFLLFLRKINLMLNFGKDRTTRKHGSCRPAIAGYQRGHNPGKNRQPWATHQGPALRIPYSGIASSSLVEEIVGFLRHGTYIICEFTMPGMVFRMWRLIKKNYLLNWMHVTC